MSDSTDGFVNPESLGDPRLAFGDPGAMREIAINVFQRATDVAGSTNDINVMRHDNDERLRFFRTAGWDDVSIGAMLTAAAFMSANPQLTSFQQGQLLYVVGLMLSTSSRRIADEDMPPLDTELDEGVSGA